MPQYPLGRIPSEFDARDYKLKNYMPKGIMKFSLVREMNWEFPAEPLDQGETNHCVGFSIADFGINLPVNYPDTEEDAHRYYYMAKIHDGHPGEEDGSTIRSAAKTLRELKRVNTYAFATKIEDIKWWLLNRGPLIVGTIWTEGMFKPSPITNRISPTGRVVGGHAYLLNECTADGYFGIQNSWGEAWGRKGKAYISIEDFEHIFVSGGEALAAVEITPEEYTPVPALRGCAGILSKFWK